MRMGAAAGSAYRLAAAGRGPATCSSGRFAKPFGTASGTMASSSSKTAAMCVIGDEILSGKTQDTNTNTLAKLLFDHGIELRRVEIVPDAEKDIINSVRYLSATYDLVFTSGGIGPTHDDITYESIANAFDSPLEYHQPTLDRMEKILAATDPSQKITEPRKRMALIPKNAQVVFTSPDLWVPLAIVNNNVHILPGVPFIFDRMLRDYIPTLRARWGGSPFHRVQVVTERKESDIADALRQAQVEVGGNVKIGSYPARRPSTDTPCVYVSFVSADAGAARAAADRIIGKIGGHLHVE